MKKVVVITGATSGIGQVTAEYLAKKNYTIYCLARRIGNLSNIKYLQCDITNDIEILNAIQTIVSNEKKIDVLINNAGIGVSGSIENTPYEDIKKTIDLNIISMIRMSQICLPHIRETKGKIINIGSIAGVLTIPFQTMYSLSKAAILSFSEGLALEVKPFGVKVTCIMPGDTKTNFTENRSKSEKKDSVYYERFERSVKRMEKDEVNGVNPIVVSKVIYKIIKQKNPPVVKSVGFVYKLFVFLKKLLPNKLVLYILYKMYGK